MTTTNNNTNATTVLAMTGIVFASLMRQNKMTLAALSEKTGFPMERIRQFRKNGLRGYLPCCDWIEAITGVCVFDRETYEALRNSGLNH